MSLEHLFEVLTANSIFLDIRFGSPFFLFCDLPQLRHLLSRYRYVTSGHFVECQTVISLGYPVFLFQEVRHGVSSPCIFSDFYFAGKTGQGCVRLERC